MDNLRALTTTTDASAQRAESAIRLYGFEDRITLRD
jgi:hypothetical protein